MPFFCFPAAASHPSLDSLFFWTTFERNQAKSKRGSDPKRGKKKKNLSKDFSVISVGVSAPFG